MEHIPCLVCSVYWTEFNNLFYFGLINTRRETADSGFEGDWVLKNKGIIDLI
jgi:hypothetical protein